jgi:ribonuclease P protein component
MKATITSSAAAQTEFTRGGLCGQFRTAASGGEVAFPREARILRRADFRLVYDRGIRFPGPLFAAFCLAQPAPPQPDSSSHDITVPPRISGRLGLTVPRAVGGSVERNRIKRRPREAFRMHRAELDPRWDIVINPRRASLTAPFADIERAVMRVIERCNLR